MLVQIAKEGWAPRAALSNVVRKLEKPEDVPELFLGQRVLQGNER